MVSKIDFSKKGINIVRSSTAIGKTRYVVGEVAYKALKEGKNVLHITLEQNVDSVYGMYVLKRIRDVMGSKSEEESKYSKEYMNKLNETYIREANKDFSNEGEELGDLAIVSPEIEDFREITKKDVEKYLYGIYAKNHFDMVVVDPYLSSIGVNDLEDLSHNFLNKGFVGILVMQMSEEDNDKLLKNSKINEGNMQELTSRSNTVISLLRGETTEQRNKLYIHTRKQGEISREKVFADFGKLEFNKK